jgi:hypothetical protein
MSAAGRGQINPQLASLRVASRVSGFILAGEDVRVAWSLRLFISNLDEGVSTIDDIAHLDCAGLHDQCCRT